MIAVIGTLDKLFKVYAIIFCLIFKNIRSDQMQLFMFLHSAVPILMGSLESKNYLTVRMEMRWRTTGKGWLDPFLAKTAR